MIFSWRQMLWNYHICTVVVDVYFKINDMFFSKGDSTLLVLQGRYKERHGVSNHRPHDCLLNRLFRRGSKKTSKLRVNGLFEGNSPVTGEFPAKRASNAENVSIWWRHHEKRLLHILMKWKSSLSKSPWNSLKSSGLKSLPWELFCAINLRNLWHHSTTVFQTYHNISLLEHVPFNP